MSESHCINTAAPFACNKCVQPNLPTQSNRAKSVQITISAKFLKISANFVKTSANLSHKFEKYEVRLEDGSLADLQCLSCSVSLKEITVQQRMLCEGQRLKGVFCSNGSLYSSLYMRGYLCISEHMYTYLYSSEFTRETMVPITPSPSIITIILQHTHTDKHTTSTISLSLPRRWPQD